MCFLPWWALLACLAAAVVLSTLLSAYLGDRTAASATRTDNSGGEATTKGTDLGATLERAVPAPGGLSASPGATPTASSSASAPP